VTNDDGSIRRGSKYAQRSACSLSERRWVIAPEFDQSGVSHSLSLNDPLRLAKRRAPLSVKGTPTDCVIMARGMFLKGTVTLTYGSYGVHNRGRNAART